MRLTPAEVHRARSVLRRSMRKQFEAWGYLEVDTPSLVTTPGTEVHLGYFATEWRDHKNVGHPFFLRSSPEIHLKKVLATGLPKVFEIAECFRNEGELGPIHRPAFTMLEFYEAGISFADFVTRTEELMRGCARDFYTEFPDCPRLDLAAAFPHFTVHEAFSKFAGIELSDMDPTLAAKAMAAGVNAVRADDDFETAYFKVQMECIEPELAKFPAAVLWDYPPSQAALSRIEGGVAKRFEIYLGRVELCNGFYELLDAKENRQRIRDANLRRKQLGKAVPYEDEAFYLALSGGLPECCGNALGFDRLLMALVGADTLDQVMPFNFG